MHIDEENDASVVRGDERMATTGADPTSARLFL
jgi:hypothetical protein